MNNGDHSITGEDDIRQMTLDQLQELIILMTTAKWIISLEAQNDPDLMEMAKQAALNVQTARIELENQALEEIIDELQTNEEDLRIGLKDLRGALKEMEDIEAVLNLTARFVGIIGRIVKLAI